MPIAIVPTSAPPMAIVAHTGSPVALKILFPTESTRTKSADAQPPINPIAAYGRLSTSDSGRNGAIR